MLLKDSLRAYLVGGDKMAREYRGYINYLLNSAYQGDPMITESVVRPVAAAMLQMTRDILSAARDRGELRSDMDFETLVHLTNTLVIAVYDANLLPHLNTYYQLTDEKISHDQVVDQLIKLVGAVQSNVK
jgi:hypothetical protein